jgi:hypothetical protein
MRASAAESTAVIEAKLIYATNSEEPSREEAPRDIESRLKPDFGYKHYCLLGEKSVKLKEDDEEKIDLGHQIEVSIKHKGTKKQFHVLGVNLYHQNKWLFFIEVSVQQKSKPIFIKGPFTKDGLVIIALTAK